MAVLRESTHAPAMVHDNGARSSDLPAMAESQPQEGKKFDLNLFQVGIICIIKSYRWGSKVLFSMSEFVLFVIEKISN